MTASTLPTLQPRPKSVHRMRPLWQALPGAAPSLIGSDQFTDERRPRLKNQQQHRAPARVSTLPHEDLEGVLSAIQAIEKFAGRLPEGDVEGHIRRSAHELTLAVEQRCGVEAACERLMQAVLQLDEHKTTGRLRRDFENEAPSVTRLLEAIQEQLVPALKRAGYQV
jgi:hypothetical protein